jgi:hypothetical protein
VITPRFLDRLRLEELGPNRWRTLAECRFDSAVLGARIIVPEGFETDLSSVPRVPVAFWLAGDTARKSSLVHDFLYDRHLGGRQIADDVFFEAMRCEGVSAGLAALIYRAVRWWGAGHW